MVDFNTGLFSQSRAPIGGTKSNVPTSALGAISKATTLQDENPFDSITQPLRRRKRRKVAEDLHNEGIELGTPEYFEKFRNKLVEFGDMEGAEIVEAKRNEVIDQNIKREGAQANIANTKDSVRSRQAKDDLAIKKFGFDQITTNAQLDDVDQRIAIAEKNANTQEKRLAIENARVALQARRVQMAERSLDGVLKGQELSNEGKRLDNEEQSLINDIIKDTGSKPGTAKAGSGGGDSGAFNGAQVVVNEIRGILEKGDTFGSPAGVPGLIKSSLGGLFRQMGLPVSTQSEALNSFMTILKAKIGPTLLEDTRLSGAERAMLDKALGNIDGITDEVSLNRKMDEIERILLTSQARNQQEKSSRAQGGKLNGGTGLSEERINELGNKYGL